jgi:hypothetical protein
MTLKIGPSLDYYYWSEFDSNTVIEPNVQVLPLAAGTAVSLGAELENQIRIYEADGTVRNQTVLEGDYFFDGLTELADGSILASGQRNDGTGWVVRRLDPSGAAMGSVVSLPSTATAPEFVALEGGGWATLSRDTTDAESPVRMRLYDADNAVVVEEVVVDSAAGEAITDIVATAIDGGGLVLTWTGTDDEGSDVYQQVFDADGSSPEPAGIVSSAIAGDQSDVYFGAGPDDGWSLAWQTSEAGEVALYSRLFDDDGTPADTDIRFWSDEAGSRKLEDVDALADGGWLVTWSSAGTDYTLEQQAFNIDGTARSAILTVDEDGQATADFETVVLDNGAWATAWTSYSTSDDIYPAEFYTLNIRIFSPDGSDGQTVRELAQASYNFEYLGYAAIRDMTSHDNALDLSWYRFDNTWWGGASSSLRNIHISMETGAPAGTDAVKAIGEEQVYTFAVADFGFSDFSFGTTDNNSFTGVVIPVLPSGALQLDGEPVVAGQFVAVADIPLLTWQPPKDFNGRLVLQFQVKDDGGSLNGGDDTDLTPNFVRFDVAADIELSATTIPENSPAGTEVGVLSAFNPLSDYVVTYALTDDADGMFVVEDDRVVLAAGAKLNFEKRSHYNITVRATEETGQVLEQVLEISIGDVNEGPKDLALSGQMVLENSAAGTVVGTLSFVDPDAGDTVTFSLSDDADGTFTISDGKVVVADNTLLDREARVSFNIDITATDSAGLTHSETYEIVIGNVNEMPMDISVKPNRLALPENSAAGAIVGVLSTLDPDLDDTATYSLFDDADGSFAIKDDVIVLARGAALDWETTPNYTIGVRVTDAGGLVREETFDIAIVDAIDIVFGTRGDDHLRGTYWDDDIRGLGGNDRIAGGAGADSLNGGKGDDLLRGGRGADLFIFREGSGSDVIADFTTRREVGDDRYNSFDRIDLSGIKDIRGYWDLRKNHLIDYGDGDFEITFGDHSILIRNAGTAFTSEMHFQF